jgi:TonB family protein
MPAAPISRNLDKFHGTKLISILVILVCFAIPVVSRQNGTSTPPDVSVVLNGWREFSLKDGGFEILFPKKPKHSVGQIAVSKMSIETNSYSVEDGTAYSVLYFDVPHSPYNPQDTKELLKGLRSFVASEQKGSVLNESPVSLGSNSGSMLLIGLPAGGVARAMIVVTARRLFRVLAVTQKATDLNAEKLSSQIATKYIESFKLSATVNDFPEGEVDKYLKQDPAAIPGSTGKSTRPVSVGILNGKALNLPPPELPNNARSARISGVVRVRIVLDEEGKVIAAQADSGPEALRAACVAAVRSSRFSPTLQDGKPVKVVGTVQYNFLFD